MGHADEPAGKGRGRRKGRMVEVDEIRPRAPRELGDTRAGASHGRAIGCQPFGIEPRVDHHETRGLGIATSSRLHGRPQHRQRHGIAGGRQAPGEVEAVGPNAADRIGGHQDTAAGQHAGQHAASRAGSGSGRPSWMSLKASN